MVQKYMRFSHASETENELIKMLKGYETLVLAADLKNLDSGRYRGETEHDVCNLLRRYADESSRVVKISPIGLAALLGALANTALIYHIIPRLQDVQMSPYWKRQIVSQPKYKVLTPEKIIFECSFFELIKIAKEIGLLETVGLRRKVLQRIVSAHGFGEPSVDFVPSSDFGTAKNTLHTVKDFRNVLHPGKLLETLDARSEDFLKKVVLQGIVLVAFLTELLMSQDFDLIPGESKG